MSGAVAVLATLRDVPGVEGSFLVSVDGELVARDMPAMFTPELLGGVAPRVLRMIDVFAGDGADVMSCLVRYREHLLFLRAMQRGAVGVLALLDVNLPALKMGVNLAVRRLAPLLDPPRATAPPAPRPPPAPVVPAAIPGMPTAPTAAGIHWRGGVVSKRT